MLGLIWFIGGELMGVVVCVLFLYVGRDIWVDVLLCGTMRYLNETLYRVFVMGCDRTHPHRLTYVLDAYVHAFICW